MTYDEFLSAAVALAIANGYDPSKGGGASINQAIEALLGPQAGKVLDVLRMAVRIAAGETFRYPAWLNEGRDVYEEITHGST